EKLIEKYILPMSEFEINLPFKIRNNFILLYNQGNIRQMLDDELLDLFDDCIKEVIKLMYDSFTRFSKTCEYLKLPFIKNLKSYSIHSLDNNNNNNNNNNNINNKLNKLIILSNNNHNQLKFTKSN